jgi:hypothetical protein
VATDPEVWVRPRRYQIFWEVVGLERGPLSFVSTIKELLGRKCSSSILEDSFWKLVPRQKFPNLKISEIVHSSFGSTHLCEFAYFYQQMAKSKQSSNMTDEHLQDSLKLALTQYSPDFQQMVDEMQTQTSH